MAWTIHLNPRGLRASGAGDCLVAIEDENGVQDKSFEPNRDMGLEGGGVIGVDGIDIEYTAVVGGAKRRLSIELARISNGLPTFEMTLDDLADIAPGTTARIHLFPGGDAGAKPARIVQGSIHHDMPGHMQIPPGFALRVYAALGGQPNDNMRVALRACRH
jgi:hypothetical protein